MFKLSGTSRKKYTVVLSFGEATTPGAYPAGGLALDTSGAVYGNAEQGGASNKGVFFKLVP